MSRMESDDTRARVRVKMPEELKEEYRKAVEERGSTMSEDLREHIREVTGRDRADENKNLPEDPKLRDAYVFLVEATGNGEITVMWDEVAGGVAQATGLPKSILPSTILPRLGTRDLIKIEWGNITVKPWDGYEMFSDEETEHDRRTDGGRMRSWGSR